MGEAIWTDYEFYAKDPDTLALLVDKVHKYLQPECFDDLGNGAVRAQGICNYGWDGEMERWCVEHEVAFNVTIESKYDIQGNTRWWRPGMSTDGMLIGGSIDVDQDGCPVIQLSGVLEAITGHEGMAPEEVLGSLRAWVEDLLPPPLDTRYKDGG